MRSTSRYKAVEVSVADDALSKRLVVAGFDPAIGLLSQMAQRRRWSHRHRDSACGEAACPRMAPRREVHVGGSHIQGPARRILNVLLIGKLMPEVDSVVMTLASWDEGFVVARGIRFKSRIENFANRKVHLVNREPGSGSRALLDSLRRSAGIRATGVTDLLQRLWGMIATKEKPRCRQRSKY